MQIGSDLDGVWYKFTKSYVTHVNGCTTCGFNLGDPEVEAETWDWFEEHGVTRDQFVLGMECAVDKKQLFWEGDLYEDTIPTDVRRLRKAGHSVHVVTHRFSGRSSDATHHWIYNNVGWVDSITLSRDKTSIKTDVFIEDNVDNYDALVRAGVNAFLVNRPYNQLDDDRQRVNSFREFTDRVLAL